MSERIQKLKRAVETVHECRATHEGSSPIRETFQGQPVWEGVVESFALTGHPKAARCYAWSYQTGAETHYTAVLELPPVDSPESAVKVAVAAQSRK